MTEFAHRHSMAHAVTRHRRSLSLVLSLVGLALSEWSAHSIAQVSARALQKLCCLVAFGMILALAVLSDRARPGLPLFDAARRVCLTHTV